MGKTKMRCMTCGKWFQSANAREVTCPDCTQKARKEKQAQKNTQATVTQQAGTAAPIATQVRPPAPPKPKTTAGGTNQWLDKVDDVKIAQPEPPVVKPKIVTPPVQRESEGGHRGADGRGEREQRGTGTTRDPDASSGGNGTAGTTPSSGQRQQPRQPMGRSGGGPGKPWQKGAQGNGGPRAQYDGQKPRGKPKAKVSAPPKPKKEKIPPPAPFVPTEEQIKQVEERYIALAQPSEFDGIRSQISKELSIPKKAVKKIIKEFREREHVPSWWELQTYKGSREELEKIKAVYEPYLPVPPVGVHKQIAEQLDIKPGVVYQAIKTIRQELELPPYNDPDLHEELRQRPGEKPVEVEKPSEDGAQSVEAGEQVAEVASSQEPAAATTDAPGEQSSDLREETQEKQEQKEDVTIYE